MTPPTANVRRYALWQLRDYFFSGGMPTIIVTALFGFIGAAPIHAVISRGVNVTKPMIARFGSADAATAVAVQELSASFLRGFLGAIIFLGALFAMHGIVANDRRTGRYRFLFAKPVSPVRYYGQAFWLHCAGYLAVTVLLALLYGWYVTPVLTPRFVGGIAAVFFFYAALAFLLSSAARWDWLSLVSVTVAATLVWEKYGNATSPLAWLLYLVPPVHRTSDVYRAVADGTALPSHAVAWLTAYGLCCHFAGLVVLRHRRLAII